MLGARSGVVIRAARANDAEALADVFCQSWLNAYRGIIPHLHLETMIRRRGPAWWSNAVRSGERVLVVEVGGRTGGYATWGLSRVRGPHEGEIYELYLTPAFQGLGLGEMLFETCRHRLDMRRLRGLLVWALASNTPAVAFYRRRGGRPALRSSDRFGRVKLEKIGFVWD